MSTEVGRSTTLPASLKFCSVPYPLEGIVPRNSFPAPVTLPPNVKVCSVPCPPRRVVPPCFRHASAKFEISSSVYTGGNRSTKLIFRFRHGSAEPKILFRSSTPHFFDSVLCLETYVVLQKHNEQLGGVCHVRRGFSIVPLGYQCRWSRRFILAEVPRTEGVMLGADK